MLLKPRFRILINESSGGETSCFKIILRSLSLSYILTVCMKEIRYKLISFVSLFHFSLLLFYIYYFFSFLFINKDPLCRGYNSEEFKSHKSNLEF